MSALPVPAAGSGSGSDCLNLPPPSYEEFLRIARAGSSSPPAPEALAASGAAGGSLYPTLTNNHPHPPHQHHNHNVGVGLTIGGSDVSSIGSDSCGHPARYRPSAAAALMRTSVEPNLSVGVDGRLAYKDKDKDCQQYNYPGGNINNAQAQNLHWTTAQSPLLKHDDYPLVASMAAAAAHHHAGINTTGGSPLGHGLDASSGASSGNKSSKSSKSSTNSSMLVIRAAEPYVRPPPQPPASQAGTACAGSAEGGSVQGSCGSAAGSSVGGKPKAVTATSTPLVLSLSQEEDEQVEVEQESQEEAAGREALRRQLQQQVKASRAAAALKQQQQAAQQQHHQHQQQQVAAQQWLAQAQVQVQQGQQGQQQHPPRPAERRLSIPRAEVGASSRDTIRCGSLVVCPPPSAATTNGTRSSTSAANVAAAAAAGGHLPQRRLSLTEVRRYLDSDSEPEAEAEVQRLAAEFHAKLLEDLPSSPAGIATGSSSAAAAAFHADGIPTTVLTRRHTYTIGSSAATPAPSSLSSSYYNYNCNYNGVGVSPNTTLHTSITTLDDPFGNRRRRASMSKLHDGLATSYEASHPRGRLSVSDTRFLILDPNSDEDDDGDEADDERDNGGAAAAATTTKLEANRTGTSTGRRHKRAPFRRRSSSASATALAALVPSASPSFPTGSVGGDSDDGSENVVERHPSFANRRRIRCGKKTATEAEPSAHSADYFAASCHDGGGSKSLVPDHKVAVRTGLTKSDPGLRLPLDAMEVGFLPLNDTTRSKEPTVIHRATSLVNLHRPATDTTEKTQYDLSASGKRYPRSSSIDLLRSRLVAAPSTDAAGILSRVPQRQSILTVRTMEESVGQSGDVCREMGRLRRMSRLGSYHGSMEDGDEVQLDAAAAATKDEDDADGATKERRRSSMISFNEVEVRSYPITAGDHPCVSSGPPLTLQWDAVDQRTIDLEEYESTRPQYRSREQMYMPAKVRVEALRSEGHPRSVIEESTEKAKEGKGQRKQTRRKSGVVSAAEHALERSKRGLKNMVNRKKKDDEKKFLQAARAVDAQSRKERDDSFAKEAEAIDALAETEDLRGSIVSAGAGEKVEEGSGGDKKEE